MQLHKLDPVFACVPCRYVATPHDYSTTWRYAGVCGGAA
jgi:hypothetical protein